MSDPRILTGLPPLHQAPVPPRGVTTLPHLFQFHAAASPQNVAFSCHTGSAVRTITYQHAHLIATRLANRIRHLTPSTHDTAPAPVAAVWIEKGLDLVLSILATTYSGQTWLPLDQDVPIDRATICCQDAQATTIICDDAHLDRALEVRQRLADGYTLQVLNVSELHLTSQDVANESPQYDEKLSGPRPQDAAYLIYTSGTTGTPKGIAISHSAALVFTLSEREILGTISADIVWNGFSPAFDMFVEEMWVTIAGCGHLAVGTREECRDVPNLPNVWTERGVTIVNAVPTLIGIMCIAGNDPTATILPSSVRLINLGGEACPSSLVERLAAPGLRIFNTYGPTETTVTATAEECFPGVPITIGRPLPSYHALLLPISETDSPAPIEPLHLAEGVEGELVIGGPCVGIGYIGRPDLTAAKFISHPIFKDQRIYRTGDRVKLQDDMKIVFLGRIDTQVKHRGFRIELGEIEARISGHQDVQAAAVILANPGTDNARLQAFVVTRPTAVRDPASIHALTAAHLPSYMRPDDIIFLEADEMPRLPSGKINSKALLELSNARATAPSTDCDSSVTSLDKPGANDTPLDLLLAILRSVFPKVRVTADSDFFDDLGGHSLLAAILVSKLRLAKSELDEAPPFAAIGLQDIYEMRKPALIAAKYTVADVSIRETLINEKHALLDNGRMTGDILPISRIKYTLCAVAQLLPLLFIFFVLSIEIMVPFLLFDFLFYHANIGWAFLGAYGVYIVLPPTLGIIAIIGKWLILGKAKEGEYPLYGWYYYRWWTAERLIGLVNSKLIADSVLYPNLLRALGSKIGSGCHLGVMSIGAAADLLEIGNDVIIGADVVTAVSLVERGRLVLRKVKIGSDVNIGNHVVIEGGACLQDGADLGDLSMVPSGMIIPSFQRFHGSPAVFDRMLKEDETISGNTNRPSTLRHAALFVGSCFASGFLMPLIYLLPQAPGLLLFDAVDIHSTGAWGQVAVLSIPIALLYQVLVFAQLIAIRYLVIGKLKPGRFSIYGSYYLRKWFTERVMDLALEILHPVFATLYIVPFLRLLGVRIGKRAEVSTARSLSFELLEIGEESFVADSVMMGPPVVRNGFMTLEKTTLKARAFAGNASFIPQGSTMESGTLVGVLSVAPSADKALKPNTSCFGSPPVRMPARQIARGHNDHLLFTPSRGRIAARLTIEGLRIVLPRALIVFGLGFGLQVAYEGYDRLGAVPTLAMLPLFYMVFFALPALFVTAALKWLLIGRYKAAEWPLWSKDVWMSEAITSTWETITEPLLASMLVGTPYLAMCFRLMGVKIGRMTTLLASDITEYDCVSIGDEAVINITSGCQTHLFEDRVMKIGPVNIGPRATLKPYSVCLPGCVVEDGAQLGCLSLVMKGETVPAGTAWEGAPIAPRASRPTRAGNGSLASSSGSCTK